MHSFQTSVIINFDILIFIRIMDEIIIYDTKMHY